MSPSQVTIELPKWLVELHQGLGQLDATDEARMQVALELAERNVSQGSGGPFAAIVVEESTGECVAAGVNLVVASGLSIAHAEALAVMLAQRHAGSFDLAGATERRYSLYATGQPCIMCFGVVWWSGITKLACAARAEDIQRIAGFQEGPVQCDWATLLSARTDLPPIAVVQDLLRERACAVLQAYVAAGHPIYNPGSPEN